MTTRFIKIENHIFNVRYIQYIKTIDTSDSIFRVRIGCGDKEMTLKVFHDLKSAEEYINKLFEKISSMGDPFS